MAEFAVLDGRGVLALSGEDRVDFLQGLTSNDVRLVGAGRAIFSAFLTAQGKYLHDFFIVEHRDQLLLDCEAERRQDLLRRLGMYKLRSKIALADASETWTVAAAFGDGAPGAFGLPDAAGAAAAFGGGIAYVDPRLVALGVRLVLPRDGACAALAALGLAETAADAYDRHRLAQGVPDGSRDLVVEKSTLVESSFDELNAISWTKGCYMGQELTARTKYRGLVKRRLVPVSVTGPLPPPGTPILRDGREVGELRSGRDGDALAMLRIEVLGAPGEDDSKRPLTAGEARVAPRRPAWGGF